MRAVWPTESRFDALNRPTLITSQGQYSYRVAFLGYDEGENARGRLVSLDELLGSAYRATRFGYDAQGRVRSKRQGDGGAMYAVEYDYAADTGKLRALTLPSGRVLQYGYGPEGRVNAITLASAAGSRPIVSAAAYFPFGPLARFSFGNGSIYARGFDSNGRIISFNSPAPCARSPAMPPDGSRRSPIR